MDNERGIHLDYFTINYEEQLSALYGGYLQNQKQFLQICIRAVQRLYAKSGKSHKTVVLIGHSMGGKVAQSILEDAEYAKDVNSIIFISSPIDSAVVNLDSIMNEFYTRSNSYLSTRRTAYLPQADTNLCRAAGQMQQIESNESTVLENVLLISIGGGNRDLLVRDALTSSKYSDVHAMTSSIPKVWLSCDHLSAVWCLQLIMVINRFLFGITNIDGNSKNVFFIDDKLQRNETALNYFVKPINRNAFNGVQLLPSKSMDNSMTWTEDSKIVLRKHFKNGLRSNHHHLIPLNKYKGYKKIYVEINGYDLDNDWIFGCKSFTDKANKIVCNEATSLSHFVQNIPSHQMEKTMALIDIENMLKSFPEWTHILVRIPSGSKPIILKIDVYKMQERRYIVKAPKWFMLKKKDLINETVYGTIHYEVLITDLTEPFPTLEFNIEPIGCVNKEFHVVTKLCIPWARGFQRYQHITHNSNLKAVYVNVPVESPNGYNSTTNPLSLELFLDPVCRYKISYRFSIEATSSKIVQEFYHWLPAHLVCVLIMVLRNIIVKFQNSQKSLFVKPYAGFFQCKSLYIITGCRLLYKLILPLRLLPVADVPNYSFFISIIIHSTAIVASILSVFIVWTILTLHGNILYKIALRITRLSVSSSNVFLQIISTLPLTFGVAFISIAFATCSGIALVLSAIFYFILISNSYKDYLENWAWETASGFYKKLRKSRKQRISKVKTDVVPLIESRSELIESDSANEINATEQLEQNDTSEDEEEYFEGLENFSFHITMLLLLIIMSALNVGLTIAWIKSKYQNHIFEQLADPHFWPTVLVLSCLSLLLQLNAPHKSRGYNCCISILLYISSCCCIIYSQENIYQLNYIIGFVYLIITIQELGHRLWAHYS